MKIRNYSYYNQERDIDDVFYNEGTVHYNINSLCHFDEGDYEGVINFRRNQRKSRFSFNLVNNPFEESQSWNFPPAYPDNPDLPFRIDFLGDNCVRFRLHFKKTGNFPDDQDSVMLLSPEERTQAGLDGVLDKAEVCQFERTDSGDFVYQLEKYSLILRNDPFALEIYDQAGKLLVKTLNPQDSQSLMNYAPVPLSFAETYDNLHRYSALSLSHHVGEHFYGLGESFTKIDKSGQKITLWTQDAHGSEGQSLYKPVPFYMSSRGYGVFLHTGACVTADLGWQFAEAQTLFIDDDLIDVFFFIGSPKEILQSYTALTGRSPLPPLWSFGLWMSRITYDNEAQARDVAKKLKEYRIPCDVIHLDTGWFEHDWLCDFKFSSTRFDDPAAMCRDFAEEGYHVTLWQYPYFTPKNPLFQEVIDQGYAILNADKELPSHDAILDFSNPEAVVWYQAKLKELFDIGVSAVKVDFGEAAPLEGIYHSGHSGRLEHNLYPLRYNKACAEITEHVQGESIIWARSAWAGSQRYPLHWGGDTEVSNMGMQAVLRGGLSLGSCGFSFFSNDAGGFAKTSREELYARWMFMSIFTSHIRCHGQPPKEPWAFSTEFLDLFRKQMEWRYRLMPYIMTHAAQASQDGYPLQQSMFFAYPDDPNCYELEDQYMFGPDLLIAPLFEDEQNERSVYLPAGQWYDPFHKITYEGQGWQCITKNPLEGVLLVRVGSYIPLLDSALTTSDLDWSTLELYAFGEPQANEEQKPLCLSFYDPESHSLQEREFTSNQIHWML